MSDFSISLAQEIISLMTQGAVRTPPSNIFVGVFDTSDTERSTDFANNRAGTTAGIDWNVVGANSTDVQNANEISLGEANVDVNDLENVALFDSATGGNKLAEYTMDAAPFDVSAGTTLLFAAGDLSFDVRDETE
jgi:hypothetical protein